MGTIKNYTDVSQSNKLARILPLESADMYLDIDYDVHAQKYKYHLMTMDDQFDDVCIPCWSLAALLGVLPNYKLSSEHNCHTCTVETSFGKETVGWFDSPIDACVAMIEKLHELRLF